MRAHIAGSRDGKAQVIWSTSQHDFSQQQTGRRVDSAHAHAHLIVLRLQPKAIWCQRDTSMTPAWCRDAANKGRVASL